MKTQSSKRILKLLRQFPVIGELCAAQASGNPKINISVQVADLDFMYWHADNILGDDNLLTDNSGRTGRRFECAYAVDAHNRILHTMQWGNGGYHFIKDLAGVIPHGSIDYILVQSGCYWLNKVDADKEKGPRPGKMLDRTIHFTVHLKPHQGFSALMKEAAVCSNVTLTNKLMAFGMSYHDWPFMAASDKLATIAKSFEDLVYSAGLKELVQATAPKVMTGHFHGVRVTSWCVEERVTFTFEATHQNNAKLDDTFTIIGNAPLAKAKFGWAHINTTANRAFNMVHAVIDAWVAASPTERAELLFADRHVVLEALEAAGI